MAGHTGSSNLFIGTPWWRHCRTTNVTRLLGGWSDPGYYLGFTDGSCSVTREMWDLINVNDSPNLTVEQLESGVATVTQSEDFFDCHPAVVAAFKLTKRRVETNEDEEPNKEKGKPKTLEFSEFKVFLTLLRQYYVYCQVSHSLRTR